MKFSTDTLVVMKGEKVFKHLCKLISETVKGGVHGGSKGREETFGKTQQGNGNNGQKKVRLWRM